MNSGRSVSAWDDRSHAGRVGARYLHLYICDPMKAILTRTGSVSDSELNGLGQRYHLAQMNIARSVAPLDSPFMASFLELVPVLNSLAEQSPGFVWRLKTSEQIADDEGGYADPLIVVNLSLWTGVEALRSYFDTDLHQAAFEKRHEWFEPTTLRQGVIWWNPSGSLPTVAEGKRRLCTLNEIGDTVQAFSMFRPFPPPDSDG